MAISAPDATRAPPTLLSYGFRPFFLLAAMFAVVAVLAWLPLRTGAFRLPLAISARDWHLHEMIYGYAAAVIAGFLLTAIPNWTGRPPVRGAPLLALAVAWLGGRVAMAFSEPMGALAASFVDMAFLALVAAMAGREIIVARNWRNLKVLAMLATLALGNALFHVETQVVGAAVYSQRLGLATVVALVMLIGGRIVPAFTRNGLMRAGPGRLPASTDRLDAVCLGMGFAALAAWVVAPEADATATALGGGAVAQALRLGRWAGERTVDNRLLLVLHVGYAFIPLGLALAALAALLPGLVPGGAATHAWGVGAIGVMTTAVMSRATLGHTGRALIASTGAQIVYALLVAATLARIAATFDTPLSPSLMYAAVATWTAAFAGFVAIYGPMLWTRPEPQRATVA